LLQYATLRATLWNMPWHAVKIRSDLHRIVQAQAAEQSRSVAGQVDYLLTRALEQASGNSPGPDHDDRPSHRGAPASARASAEEAEGGSGEDQSHRPAPRAQIEGQTDLYEMLAACPECGGPFTRVGESGEDQCGDCGFTREP
jgi:hypothetical protein